MIYDPLLVIFLILQEEGQTVGSAGEAELEVSPHREAPGQGARPHTGPGANLSFWGLFSLTV